MILHRITATLAAALAFASTAAYPLGMSLELGNGDDADMARVGLQWEWKRPLLQWSNWNLGGYWDAAIGYWHSTDATPTQNKSIVELALTPVMRLQPNGLVGPYVEGGVGFHLLSHTSIGTTRMSTAFQFGNHIGVGYRFGARGSYDLGYRFQHLSNASIKRPNAGINFNQIRLQYNF